MACSLKTGFFISGSFETLMRTNAKGSTGLPSAIDSLQFTELGSKGFMGEPLQILDQKNSSNWKAKAPANFSVHARASICVSRALRWWEKTLKRNMIEIHSAQELVDSLSNAGDRLVIVNFYAPGCGGCRALHPKICHLAESNPNAIFLKVNYEELKTMCHGLHIHVLPFFRFYRGAEGRLCSFSCTNATIKKFKDALTKYGTDGYGLGPAKGLDESELLRLASIGEISMNLPSKFIQENKMQDLILKDIAVSGTLGEAGNKMGLEEKNAILMA